MVVELCYLLQTNVLDIANLQNAQWTSATVATRGGGGTACWTPIRCKAEAIKQNEWTKAFEVVQNHCRFTGTAPAAVPHDDRVRDANASSVGHSANAEAVRSKASVQATSCGKSGMEDTLDPPLKENTAVLMTRLGEMR